VVYTFTLTNTGALTDTFTLTASGAWAASLPGGASTGPLAAGASLTVVLEVVIPPDASNGARDTATLTAVSTFNSLVSASVSAETTAVRFQKIYLPLILK